MAKGATILSVAGSAASIIALVLVLVDSTGSGIDPQYMVWRLVLPVIALVACGGVITVVFLYTRALLRRDLPDYDKTAKIFVVLAGGLLLLAVFGDGFFAAIYWRVWLEGVFNNFSLFFHH